VCVVLPWSLRRAWRRYQSVAPNTQPHLVEGRVPTRQSGKAPEGTCPAPSPSSSNGLLLSCDPCSTVGRGRSCARRRPAGQGVGCVNSDRACELAVPVRWDAIVWRLRRQLGGLLSAIEVRLPGLVPLDRAAGAAGPRRDRQGPGDLGAAPPAHGVAFPRRTSQAGTR